MKIVITVFLVMASMSAFASLKCSDSDFVQNFPVVSEQSANAKIFDKAAYEEIRTVARNVFDDFEGLVRSDISGNNQCSDKVINWANEVITDAACLRIAIELAYNIDNFLGQSAHRQNTRMVTEFISNNQRLAIYRRPMSGYLCHTKYIYLDLLEFNIENFALAAGF